MQRRAQLDYLPAALGVGARRQPLRQGSSRRQMLARGVQVAGHAFVLAEMAKQQRKGSGGLALRGV